MRKSIEITENLIRNKMNTALIIAIIGIVFCSVPFGIWSACVYGKYSKYCNQFNISVGKQVVIAFLFVFDIVFGATGVIVDAIAILN